MHNISVYTLSCIVMCEFGIVAVSGYLLCGKNKFFTVITYLVITRGEVTPKVALWLAYKPIASSSIQRTMSNQGHKVLVLTSKAVYKVGVMIKLV